MYSGEVKWNVAKFQALQKNRIKVIKMRFWKNHLFLNMSSETTKRVADCQTLVS